jgi:hypothetical protein
VIGLIISIFYLGFFLFLKPETIKWKKQIPTRGLWLWRSHLVAYGLSHFWNVISTSFVAVDGTAQRALIALRGVCWFGAFLILFWITLVDCYVVPSSFRWDIGAIIVCSGIAFSFMSQIASPTPGGLIGMTILLPIGASFFHLLAMLPVCFKRKAWAAIAYVILMCGFNLASFFCELYGNGPLCEKTTGILSGMTLGVLIAAFYRVFAQVFYTSLKESEKDDGLPLKRRGIADPSSSVDAKPFPVEFDDYSYDYTDSDSRGKEH